MLYKYFKGLRDTCDYINKVLRSLLRDKKFRLKLSCRVFLFYKLAAIMVVNILCNILNKKVTILNFNVTKFKINVTYYMSDCDTIW